MSLLQKALVYGSTLNPVSGSHLIYGSRSSPLIPNRKLILRQKEMNGLIFFFFQERNITKEKEKAIFSFCTPPLISFTTSILIALHLS